MHLYPRLILSFNYRRPAGCCTISTDIRAPTMNVDEKGHEG